MALSIHPLTPDDHAEVLAVARLLATWFQPLDQMALAIDLREHEGLVARRNGQIVAFLTYHQTGDQRAELSWLGVSPDAHGQGIGGLLLGALEALLSRKGLRQLHLHTVPSDTNSAFGPTNDFYRQRGYQIRRREENFYAFGRPGILLTKELATPDDTAPPHSSPDSGT